MRSLKPEKDFETTPFCFRGTPGLFGTAAMIVGLALTSLPAQAGQASAHAPAHRAAHTPPAHAQTHVQVHAERKPVKQAKEKVTTLAATDPDTTSSIRANAGDGLNCDRSRKRLWVESEGWIVRQVTTCY